MLQEIIVAGHATYSAEGQSLAPCKPINFVFGTNGSGKTTISRVIADSPSYPSCRLTWANGRVVERLVYNSDFMERNFTSNMKGIFTLGKESVETIARIEAAKAQQLQNEGELRSLQDNLKGADGVSGKQGDLTRLRSTFEGTCWDIKGRHDDHFRDVFTHAKVRSAKADFCAKILAEQQQNTATQCDLEELKVRAKSVFQKGLVRLTLVAPPSFEELLKLESAPILAKKVIGKEDVNVSALIKRLGNSDWVKQGRSFLDQSDNICPFCQQELLSDLASDLNDYFDESYAADVAALDRLQAAYATYSSNVFRRLEEIATSENEDLSNDSMRANIDRLSQRFQLNSRQLEAKKKEPSAVVVLEPLAEIAKAITLQIEKANAKIVRHNQLVENISFERGKLIAEAWRSILNESKTAIDSYLVEKSNLDKAVVGLGMAIESKKTKLAEISGEITTMERSITSVQPTVNEINGILASFGFTSFRFATSGEHGNIYKIIRSDGSDASKSLSEGERSFITFLYFYHLIRGSVSESGMTADRIVVFDDPVSSLDSDVLFIVSSLIKKVLEDACDGKRQVKQVFVLTHNIYFHKEVSFDPKRGDKCRPHESFWIVRKKSGTSVVTGYDHNPIKTSYELLWSEVRSADRSNLTLQNTLRRILESYFKLLGNMDRNEIAEYFDGQEKQICGSLFSWVNDGSHSAHDDLYISADNEIVEIYLKVFKRIFEQTGHLSHYNMMMGKKPD